MCEDVEDGCRGVVLSSNLFLRGTSAVEAWSTRRSNPSRRWRLSIAFLIYAFGTSLPPTNQVAQELLLSRSFLVVSVLAFSRSQSTMNQ